MSKTRFEKTAHNVAIDRPIRDRSPKFSRRSWQFEIDINVSERMKIQTYMKAELAYYNWLVRGLSSRMRTMPDSILEPNENIEKLYLICAEISYDPYPIFLMRKVDFEPGQEPELPYQLEPYRDFLFGKNEKKERRFNEKVALMCQLFAMVAPIHPIVRRNIAIEMINFFKEQARASLQSVPIQLRNEQLYKSAPQSLEVYDIIRKRHLQIPRKIVEARWDEKAEHTAFKIPYLSQEIIVPNMDFVKENTTWNFLILHQVPGGMALPKTPWVLDVRNIQNHYLLSYTDARTHHSSAAFHQAKRNSTSF